MTRMVPTLVAAFAFAYAAPSLAGKPPVLRLDGVIRNSDAAIATVAESRVRQESCAPGEIQYSVESVKAITGKWSEKKLCSAQRLLAGATYVFFIKTGKSPASQPAGEPYIALLVTDSFLDTTARWVEVDAATVVDPAPVKVQYEQIDKCVEDAKPAECRVVRVRELVRLSDLVEHIEKLSGNADR